MSTVNGFQVGSEILKYNYESLDNYNTPNFSTSSSKTYAVGDYVMYNGKLYKCITATTGGTWVSGSWTEAVLSNDVSNLTGAINDGLIPIDLSKATNGYFRTQTIGDTQAVTPNALITTLLRCADVIKGNTYQIVVEEADTLQQTGRKVAQVTDAGNKIRQVVMYMPHDGETDVLQFTADLDGKLGIEVEANYKSIKIRGSEVFQAKHASDEASDNLLYLANTGRYTESHLPFITGVKYAIYHFNLPAGTYHFTCDSIESTDTDSDKSMVNLGGGSTAFRCERNVPINVTVILPNASTTQYFYAGNGANPSEGDIFTYKNIRISRIITDSTLTETGKYADAKATGDLYNGILIEENSSWEV